MKKSEIKIWIGFAGIFVTILVAAFRIGAMKQEIMTALEDLPQMKADIAELKTKVSALDVKVSEMSVKVDVLWRDHLSSATPTKFKKASLPVASPHSPSASTYPQAAR